ncbi:MAG: hypothetical protein KY410_09545, partial [Proteobacteria bacterium]|nr:hypothetical protein [Pseudomonadota bacterium]
MMGAAHAAVAPGEGLRFHHYSQDDGLVQNTVQSVVQDAHGFLWFGTEDGLHRFDGYEMLVYQAKPGDPAGLQADGIQDLAVDENGDLWVATYGGGVSRLSATTGRFTHYLHDPDNAETLRSNFVFRIALDTDGSVWAITNEGLDRVDPATGNVRRFTAGETSGLTSNDHWSILVDSTGTTWLGALDGLFVYSPEQQRFSLFREGDERYEAFHDHTVSAMAEAPDGSLLLATRSGVHRLDGRRELADHFSAKTFGLATDADVRIGRILATSTGEIWASSFANGVYWWDDKTGNFRNYRHDPADTWSLPDDVILSMYEDRTGIVWFGTQTGGVSKFNPPTRAFKHFRHQKNQLNSLPNRVVWSIMEDRKGHIWTGTDGGLSRLDRQRGEYRHYLHDPGNEHSLSSPFVLDVLEDAKGRIWVGTYEGVDLLDPATGHVQRFRFTENVVDEYFANSISFLFEAEGLIWAGTAEGLFSLDPDTGVHRKFLRPKTGADGVGENLLTAAEPARAGGWWIGSENGVARFDPATGEYHESYVGGKDGVLSQPFVFDVMESRDGTLWVATDYKLNRIDPDGRATRYGIEEGLLSNTIYSVLEDGTGKLWIATNNGLARLDPASGDVHVFDTTDGLQSNEFNSAARFRSPAGELFFGGINGLNAFFPSTVTFETQPPGVAITKFFRFNEETALDRPISALDRLALSWRDSVIGFEFAVFDYAAPTKNRFRYRLEGFDAQWLEATGHNHVTYTNLDAGEYLLRVQGANRHGVW